MVRRKKVPVGVCGWSAWHESARLRLLLLTMAEPGRPTAVIVSPVLPLPEIQGNRRVIAALVRWLAARRYVVKFVVQGRVADPVLRERMAELGAELVEVEGGAPARSAWWKFTRRAAMEMRRFDRWNRQRLGIRAQLSGIFPSWEERIFHYPNLECWPQTCATVRRLVVETKATLVISEYVYHSAALEGLPPSVLTAVHTHDCLSQVWDKMGRYGVDTHAREISRGLERRFLRRARVVLALQADEAAHFRRLAPGVPVAVLGFAPGPVPDQPRRRGEEPVVFFPASNNPANRAGLAWLLHEVWPRVRGRWPEAELRVAGEVSRWIGLPGPGVSGLGALPDLQPEYARARVVVNPVAVGTGLKIKTVEALGLGKAVVATSNALEGLPPGEDAWRCADQPAEFAEAIVSVGSDLVRLAAAERAALAYARQHLTEESVFREFAALLAGSMQEMGREP
jgi:glycosyltransferase involved in cell wall biosynthesis